MARKPEIFELSSTQLQLYPNSLLTHNQVEFGLARNKGGLFLSILGSAAASILPSFDGERSQINGKTLLLAPVNARHAAALRAVLPWLQPQPLGTTTSAGMGDRLGLATPGHVAAVRATNGTIAPIFAQQSIRENARTGRTPQQVIDDATWGAFQEGWQAPLGADADHLKTTEDIDVCLQAGYSFFTIDPGEHVDNTAETASLTELQEVTENFPAHLQPETSGLLDRNFDLEGTTIIMDKATLYKAAVKYGRAVVHVAAMYQHLANAARNQLFELEVSVDETEQPTSHAEHIYIASELKRLGVKWVSLAPRYIGRFEKGVDYIGSLTDFEADFTGHAAIARLFGGYKLSLHSGSDKFSIYPIAMRHTKGLVHLKTAGTSYLEALRTIGAIDVNFLSEIYSFARKRYPADRASYHVSAQVDRAPLPEDVSDWPGLLEQFDAREIFHVTFGSVLTQKTSAGGWQFYDRFMDLLRGHPDLYAANLEKHFNRHLQPFVLEE